MQPAVPFMLMTVLALSVPRASAATLYRCVDRGIASYSASPCAQGGSSKLSIDRATPGNDLRSAPASPRESAPAPHRLTQAERERIARLRHEAAQQTAEARIAAEVEIAAMREGADARVSREDRDTLAALRPQLASADPQVRADALTQWRALYARYRIAAHPRVQPLPPPLDAGSSRRLSPPVDAVDSRGAPQPPLGATVPGTKGPLVSAPDAPALPLPLRPPPIADPATGRLLAPAGTDRMIDPVTGTLWMRSGRVYVDPLSGRIIPAP